MNETVLTANTLPKNSDLINSKIPSQIPDRRSKSAMESLMNSLGGFPIAYLVGMTILPMSGPWIQHDPIMANLAITTIFATISFVRTYYLRRLFAKYGFDDNLVRLSTRGIFRLVQSLRMAHHT